MDAPPTPATSAPAPFPSTLWTEVLALQTGDPDSRRDRLQNLILRYWKPVYWAIRADGHFREDEARDLTQEFFIRILEGKVVATVDPARGSFRQYLKGALRFLMLDEWKKGVRQRTGGGRTVLSLDFDSVGPEPEALGHDPDRALDRAWGLQILDEALKDLETMMVKLGRTTDLQVFRAYELCAVPARPSYSSLAAGFGVTPREIRVMLKYCRRKLRETVMEKIEPYVRNETELTGELRDLFGE